MKLSKKQFETLVVKQGDRLVAQNVVTRKRATKFGVEDEVLINTTWLPMLGVTEKYFYLNDKQVFISTIETSSEVAKEAVKGGVVKTTPITTPITTPPVVEPTVEATEE